MKLIKVESKMAKIEKVDLKSKDIKSEQVERLKAIFPEVIADGKINFEQLKATLGEDVEDSSERFGMTWAGKAKCFRIIQDPSTGTLKPNRDDSINFDSTQNLFIEGDNLEVLKLLQKSYYEKIKMIYIDPPYNTGKDFVYPDKFGQQMEEYLRLTGQVDDEGKRLSTNADTGGRFHSNWLNMMYPRLFLARNLLTADGVIFISIDDNEVDNLRTICNEIFGEENFITEFPRITKKAGKTTDLIAKNTDYLLCYGKSENIYLNQNSFSDDAYNNSDEFEEERGKFKLSQTLDYGSIQYSPSLDYEIELENHTFRPGGSSKEEMLARQKRNPPSDFCWRWSKELFKFGLDAGFVVVKESSNGKRIYTKTYQNAKISKNAKGYYVETIERTKPTSTLEFVENIYSNDNSRKDLAKIFDSKVFEYSKPVSLLKKLTLIGTNPNDIVLDFFAGSGTTGHAVLELNKEVGGNRKFICIQLPEQTDANSEAYKAGFKSISEISRERLKKVISNIESEEKNQKTLTKEKEIQQDLGFKSFCLDKSNFKKWDSDPETIQSTLTDNIEQIKTTANPEDVLYEILLKDGFELTTDVQKKEIGNIEVFSIENDLLLVCLDEKLNLELFKEMKKLNPHIVIVLDKGFKDNDQLKTNAVQSLGKNSDEEYILRAI
jgi:adenine-specific DNA-methyltransferase